MKPVTFRFTCARCQKTEPIESRVTDQIENSAPEPPRLWQFTDGKWWCGECFVKAIEGEVIKD